MYIYVHTDELSWIHGDIRGRLYRPLFGRHSHYESPSLSKFEIHASIDLCRYKYNMYVYIYTYTQMSCHGYTGTSEADCVDYSLAHTVIITPHLYRNLKYLYI